MVCSPGPAVLGVNGTGIHVHVFPPGVGQKSSRLAPPRALLAHLVYWQNLLEFRPIDTVYWTLCIEFQFYLGLALLMAASGALARRFGKPPGPRRARRVSGLSRIPALASTSLGTVGGNSLGIPACEPIPGGKHKDGRLVERASVMAHKPLQRPAPARVQ